MSGKIEARNVSVRLSGEEILKGVSTVVPEGEIFTIIGPSGAGKSTFLRTLNRLIETEEGEVLLDGESVKDIEPRELRRRVGMVFQIPVAFSGTVEENVLMGPELVDRTEPDVSVLLSKVGLGDHFLNRKASELSVGEQQRMCIARALANDPEVLLMDEPTSSLDPASSRKIESLVKDLKAAEGLTLVMVSHDMEQSKRIGDWTMMMKEGEVRATMRTGDFFKNFDPEGM